MKQILSFIFPTFLFFLDVNFYLGVGVPLFFYLLSWYCVQLLFFETPFYWFPLVLLCLESFLYFGIFGLELIWIIPLTILFSLFSQSVSFLFFQPLLMVLIALLSKFFFSWAFFGIAPSGLFTMGLICVNLIITLIFSLKYKGKLGNRFSLG